jgi:hypothetical protein
MGSRIPHRAKGCVEDADFDAKGNLFPAWGTGSDGAELLPPHHPKIGQNVHFWDSSPNLSNFSYFSICAP